MKAKMISLLLGLAVTLSFLGFAACNEEVSVSIDPTQISVSLVRNPEEQLTAAVISVKNAQLDEGTTLSDIMQTLKDQRTFTYEIAGGMLTEINGVKNAADYSRCWLLYTGDEEMANTAWGTYEYNGEILGSAILGANDLPVKTGEVYVWAYQEMNNG